METVTQFLRELELMIAEKPDKDTFPTVAGLASWEQVPEKYKNGFLDWCVDFHGDSWAGIEETGWMTYAHEYLAYLIDQFIQGIETTKEEVLDRMTSTDEQKTD